MYDSNPKENKDAKLIDFIDEITEEIEAATGGAGTNLEQVVWLQKLMLQN